MNMPLVARAAKRFRPPFGWLVFILLLGTLICLASSVLEVEWVRGERAFVPAMLLGFLSATLLSGRRIHPALAWMLLIVAGLALALVLTAGMWPPARVFAGGDPTLEDFWRQRASLFIDRAGGWLAAVSSGGRSTETIVFSLAMALAAWVIAAYMAWTAYRSRRPYQGLTVAGAALAANTFYGRAELYWVAFFFALAVTAGTYLNYLYRESEWDEKGTDYSTEVRGEMIFYAAGVSIGVISLAWALPAINFRAIAEAFQRQEAIVAAEETMARAFAGVTQPRTDEAAAVGAGMPRSFLLGGDPQLTETVVMTATLRPKDGTFAEVPAGYHWRSVSYDVYNGRGWEQSPEREEDIGAGETIPPPVETVGTPVILRQEVDWLYDQRATRYTVGRPVVFSHDVAVQWRGLDDLVGVRGRDNAPQRYTAESLVVYATPGQLRAVRPEDTPPEIQARYTALPDSLPQRVKTLAGEVAGIAGSGMALSGAPANAPTAYDQARAIEAFLHQYPYSLDLPASPVNVDAVDYFLFDLQTGYCDHYASAMVVMARAVGLPARLGTGYLPQPSDENGVQTLRQIDAHSWAEIYFAGFGWVEFEPTASLAPTSTAGAFAPDTGQPPANDVPPFAGVVSIPERAPQRNAPWLLLFGAAALGAVAWRLFGRRMVSRFGRRGDGLDSVQLAFAHLQDGAPAIGLRPRPAQTPVEFSTELQSAPALAGEGNEYLRTAIERLSWLFTQRQYGRSDSALDRAEAGAIWRELRGPFRRLAWRRRLGRGHD